MCIYLWLLILLSQQHIFPIEAMKWKKQLNISTVLIYLMKNVPNSQGKETSNTTTAWAWSQ